MLRRELGSDLIKDQTAIVGIGQTAFGKGLEDTELSLACQAISMALDDAGIAPGEVDGLVVLLDGERPRGRGRAQPSASATSPSSRRSATAAAPAAATIGHAAMAVATGQCEVAVAWRARKRADKAQPPVGAGRRSAHRRRPGSGRRPFGLLRPVDEIAMLTRRYMHEYGATRDHLANVAIAFRKHAEPQPERDHVREAADPRGRT